jgi:hypothetical protein
VHDFIVQLERSAKRVLKDANKKAREAALAEQTNAILAGRKALDQKKKSAKGMSKEGTVQMKSMALTSSMEAEDVNNIGLMPPGTQTLEMRYSVPKMMVSMAMDDTLDLNNAGNADMSGPPTGHLSPIKKKLQQGGNAMMSQSLEKPLKRNVTLERLSSSAYVTAATGSLDEIMIAKKKEATMLKQQRKKDAEEAPEKETTWSLKSQVNEVLTGKSSKATTLHRKLVKDHKNKQAGGLAGRKGEKQGPVDWSVTGLKSKYRGEMEREALWRSWQTANAHASTALADQEMVIPIASVERHPLYVQYYTHIKGENTNSSVRTKARLRMKRFVFDVHEVWLTNLQHLREHQPARLLKEEGRGMDEEKEEERGRGLANRRDKRAIESMEAQIQSVSQKRTLEKAYFTTNMAETKVVLNFEPVDTPDMLQPRALPPTLEVLVDGLRVRTSDAESSVDPNNPKAKVEEVALFVDRILPAADHKEEQPGELHGSVLWRMTAYRRQDVAMYYYTMTEAAVVALAEARMASATSDSKLEEVFRTPADNCVSISWAVMDLDAEVVVGVGLKDDSDTIVVKVEAFLKADYDGQVLTIITSPIELRHLLNMPNISLSDLDYWKDPARSKDLWASLNSLLYIVDGHVNEYGDPEPREMAIVVEKSAADRVTGAITTARALAIAQEFVSAVHVTSHLEVSVEGGSDIMLNHWKGGKEGEGEDEESQQDGPFGEEKTNSVDGDDDGKEKEEVDITKIVVDHSHDPPTNIGLLADVVEKDVDLDEEVAQMNKNLRSGAWEKVLDDNCSTLSMITSNALAKVAQLPGSCEIGQMGLWFEHQMPREYTQASAIFFRDARLSTTDHVLVNLSLSLDTSLIFPTVLAWEDFGSLPPKGVAEEIDGVVPALNASPGTLMLEALQSPIDDRPSQVAALFGSLPEEGVDHIPLDAPSKPEGMTRHWAWVSDKGFRQKLVTTLLGVDPVLPTVVFGITKFGATTNEPGVNSRNVWHSVLAITEHINRPRSPKDYHYIITNIETQGANDPASFSARMKAGECVGLSSSAFRTFEKEYEEIKLRREMFARQLALDAKIESSQIALQTREKALKAELQKELQRNIEKKLRKATKSERGWSRRFFSSQVLEIQGPWERRRDEKSGTIFFHSISEGAESGKKEKFMQTCQWEVPATWDGDPLAVPGDEYGPDLGMGGVDDMGGGGGSVTVGMDMQSVGSGVGSSITGGAFDQPVDSWHPAMDGMEGGADGKTPGSPSRFAPKARINDDDISVGMGSSVGADKSLAESTQATIDTANLEHIAEQLVSSDELMRVLAKRLGLSEAQVVPADELSDFSVSVVTNLNETVPTSAKLNNENALNEGLAAPRDNFADEAYEEDIDSDDDLWSDDEQEAGDADMDLIGDLPQGHVDSNKLRREKLFEGRSEEKEAPDNVPFLDLKGAGVVNSNEEQEVGAGWRKLTRPDIPTHFFQKCLETQTLGPDQGACNTFNVPVFLVPISPVDACQYVPENFNMHVESIFIPDAKKDMERAMATVERNIKREEDLAKNTATDDLLLFGQAAETTTADNYIAKQYKEDQNAFVDPREGAMRKAILAAKSNNVAEMEDALEEDIQVNTADTFGNTLLILAAQQGSKRMCKFLLRRGANLNLQSLTGNTALHYCYAYSQFELAEYLKAKGADDSILNADGMTCYEGLSAEDLAEEGDGDQEEEGEYDL